MTFVIAAHATECEKIVDGERKKVVPFMGSDRDGEWASMGVGLLFPDDQTGTMWGLATPHMLIKSWRGMKILEHIEKIDHGTLCACWYAGGHQIHSSDWRYLDELAGKLGGMKKLQALRDEVLASAPTSDELNAMIALVRENGVDISGWELEEEAKAGRIETLPIIGTILREEAERRDAYRRKDDELKKPLAREHSLGVFFGELGIDNFVDGPVVGAYSIDWGHLKLEELDRAGKRASSGKYFTEGFMLEHTTQRPLTRRTLVDSGIAVYSTTFGELEQPYYIATDGTRYTFISAKFRDFRFFLKTKVEKKGGDSTEGEFTLLQLRKMIGPVPLPTHQVLQVLTGFFTKVTSWFR